MSTDRLDESIVQEGLGPFEHIQFLGHGTFGSTFRITNGGEDYAVKVIHLEDPPDYLFEREVRSLKAADHPNVVSFRGAGRFECEGRAYPYLECEFVSGPTLERVVRDAQATESGEELRALLVGLLSGVAEIHELGIIHRDIKPANVILRDGAWGQPVLLDFGLAKVLDMSTHTLLGQTVGTPRFMAPEQMRGDPARRRSDLFAIGVVVYLAGTGRHPYADENVRTLQELHDRTESGRPPDPRSIVDGVWDDDVAEVVIRLLSYAAHERLGLTRALQDLGEDPNAH